LYQSLVTHIPLQECIKVFGGKAKGKAPSKWVDNIEFDIGEIGWGGVDWVGLAQDRDKWTALVTVVMNLRVQ
jgi:hypothetical protein